jgi:hypothetical protein
MMEKDAEGRLMATRTARAFGVDESIRREINILKPMNYPFMVQIRDGYSGASNQSPVAVTDCVANGSLAD